MRKTTIARIENDLIFNGKYQLTAKEQKVVLFLVSRLNPQSQTNFSPVEIKVRELESIITEKRNGSFAKELREFMFRLSSKQISFTSEVSYQGRRLMGHVNWFSSIMPFIDNDGEASFEFIFNHSLKPFLLDLSEYTQIDYLEVLPLSSGFSIRMYQVFKAHRAKMAKHQKRSKLKYSLLELKELLEVQDKYSDFRNFKKKVLEPISVQINEHTPISLKYTLLRLGRKVTGIQFSFWEKSNEIKPNKKSKNVKDLTFAQFKAYNKLCAYGIAEGIALEILSKVGGSEIEGFEDWYFESVLSIFDKKTQQTDNGAKAGTLVNWFLKKKVFEQSDMFARIIERLQERKKALQANDINAWDNRILAKEITAEEFRKRVRV